MGAAGVSGFLRLRSGQALRLRDRKQRDHSAQDDRFTVAQEANTLGAAAVADGEFVGGVGGEEVGYEAEAGG